jgi:hypothetical protein
MPVTEAPPMSWISYSSLNPPNPFVLPAALPEGEVLVSASSFFPQIPALLGSYYALHELIGFGWYLCRYGEW